MKLSLKNILFYGALICLIGAVAAQANCASGGKNRSSGSSSAMGTNARQKAPLFKEADYAGKQVVELEKYKGKVVLLNFFATWCPPCRMEIPDLIKLQDAYKGKLVIIGASMDDSSDVMGPFYKENKMNYAVIMGTDKMAGDYGGVAAIPTTIIIDKKGFIVTKIVGMRDYDGFVKALAVPLSEK